MELDRDWIQRTDFPQARRGYDPNEVDRHLREIAAAVDDLHAAAAESTETPTVAGTAAEQVRAIVQAAETSAGEIEAGARAEAEGVVAEARNEAAQEREAAAGDAARTRQEAQSTAAEQISGVETAAGGMRERAHSVETQLSGLVDELREAIGSLAQQVRTSSAEVESDLVAIRSGLGELREVDLGPAVAAPVAAADAEEDPDDAPADEPEQRDIEMSQETIEYAAISEEDLEEAEEDEPKEAPVAGEGAEGARLIALNMALNGTPREETARYLDENFDLEDSGAILEDVYARVGG